MTGWIVQTLVAATLLMAVVMVLRPAVRRAFGPRAAYALWALPALRMILPPLPGWRELAIPTFYWGTDGSRWIGLMPPQVALGLSRGAEPSMPALAQAPVQTPVGMDAIHASPPSFILSPKPELAHGGMWLLALWLAGAGLWLGWQMLRYRAFMRSALRDAVPLTRACGVDVLLTPGVDGPVAAGILRRRILLPMDFLHRYSAEERRLALLHEGAHHDRHDLHANLAGLALLSLHWWNPLAHRAYRLFRADQEMACDATVLGDARTDDRRVYGSAMLKSASARMPGVACALSHKTQLRERIMMMKRMSDRPGRGGAGGIVALGAIVGGLLLTASGHAGAAEPVEPYAVPSVSRPAVLEGERAARRAEAAGVRAEAAGRRAEQHANRAARDAERRADAMTVAANRRAALAEQDAQRAALAGADAQRIRTIALRTARDNLATQCAAKGRPVDRGADWAMLATCGQVDDLVQTSLTQARQAMEQAQRLSNAAMSTAMTSMDSAAAMEAAAGSDPSR